MIIMHTLCMKLSLYYNQASLAYFTVNTVEKHSTKFQENQKCTFWDKVEPLNIQKMQISLKHLA